MINKKRIVSLALATILLLTILAGCSGSKANPSPTGDSSREFEGIKIIFFTGGGEGDSFSSVVYNGAMAAEKDLGCSVEYVFSQWQPDKMIEQFRDAIAKKPDGIAIMGHPGDTALSPLIDEAESKGIIITSQNATLPKNEEKYTAKGFGYVGQEIYASGVMLAKGSVARSNLKSGDRALVWGLLGKESRGERTKGCIDALVELGITVDYLEISDEINGDASLGTPAITGYIAKHPDVKLIIMDHGSLTAKAGTYIKAAKKKPGEIFVAGFDLSAATVKEIKDGWIGCILDQQPWLQGYLPILQICLSKKYGFSGLHIDTGAALIDKNNVNFAAPLAEKGIR